MTLASLKSPASGLFGRECDQLFDWAGRRIMPVPDSETFERDFVSYLDRLRRQCSNDEPSAE